MDGHNALSVLGLPFHLMITFSGLVLFMAMLMPAGIVAAYDNERAYFDELFPAFALTPAQKTAAPLTPLAPLVQAAEDLWPGGQAGRLVVNHPGDAGAQVTVSRSTADRVSYGRLAPTVSFDGVSGQMRVNREAESAVATTAGTIVGLHLGLFAQPVLRWLYFLVSLAGTAMVGTGLVLWVAKRRQKLPAGRGDTLSLRVVDALNAGTVAGVCLGVAAFFLANRLLPLDLPKHELWESRSFFIAWGASLAYAFIRYRSKWRDLMALAALAFALVPVVNAMTTSRHLGVSLGAGDWVMAGFDLSCLARGFCWPGSRAVARAARPPRRAPRVPPSQRVRWRAGDERRRFLPGLCRFLRAFHGHGASFRGSLRPWAANRPAPRPEGGRRPGPGLVATAVRADRRLVAWHRALDRHAHPGGPFAHLGHGLPPAAGPGGGRGLPGRGAPVCRPGRPGTVNWGLVLSSAAYSFVS